MPVSLLEMRPALAVVDLIVVYFFFAVKRIYNNLGRQVPRFQHMTFKLPRSNQEATGMPVPAVSVPFGLQSFQTLSYKYTI